MARLSKKQLLQKIVSCEDMLQGSVVALNARCGKKGCKCEQGEYHGTSFYLSYREQGRTQMVYLKKELVPEVKRRLKHFKRYKVFGEQLAKLNLKDLRTKG